VTINCRALTLNDYDQTRILYQALSTGESLPSFEAGKAGFARLIQHPGTWILGAVQNDCILSMATLHILPNMTYQMRPYAIVENVATRIGHQGRGLGRQLMKTVAQKAWDEGAFKVMLLTNQARGTRSFYEKLGYCAEEKHGMILRRPTDQ
jgi:GNAT superfamily N-acetyltransferase